MGVGLAGLQAIATARLALRGRARRPSPPKSGTADVFAQIFDQRFVQTCVAEYAENAASREIFQDAMRCQ